MQTKNININLNALKLDPEVRQNVALPEKEKTKRQSIHGKLVFHAAKVQREKKISAEFEMKNQLVSGKTMKLVHD